MPSNKRWKPKNFIITTFGCGWRTKKTMSVYEPIPDSETSPDAQPSRSMSSDEECLENQCSSTSTSSGRISPKIRDSFAVEKVSEDPYLDFRQSMIQMIVEKEIYSKDDLQQLLSCFLELNSPCHHEAIVRAFVEIWEDDTLRSCEN